MIGKKTLIGFALLFDGLLGLDFLVRNYCVIDCAGRKIYFRGARPTGEQKAAMEKSLRGSGYTPVPIHPGARMIVNGKIGGRATWPDWRRIPTSPPSPMMTPCANAGGHCRNMRSSAASPIRR